MKPSAKIAKDLKPGNEKQPADKKIGKELNEIKTSAMNKFAALKDSKQSPWNMIKKRALAMHDAHGNSPAVHVQENGDVKQCKGEECSQEDAHENSDEQDHCSDLEESQSSKSQEDLIELVEEEEEKQP